MAESACPDCKGSGWYTGLQTVEKCTTCGGTGVATRGVSPLWAIYRNLKSSAAAEVEFAREYSCDPYSCDPLPADDAAELSQ